jgi:hypothetical protein
MAVNHNININLNGKGGGSTLRTSAKRSVKEIKNNASKNMHIPKLLQKYNKTMGGLGAVGGGLKYAGIAGAIAYAGVSTANKIIDIALQVRSASTGEQITIGNIKRVKSYILNPIQYAKDSIWSQGFIQQKIIDRQNQSNDYYRELTGMAIVGNQYGNKR